MGSSIRVDFAQPDNDSLNASDGRRLIDDAQVAILEFENLAKLDSKTESHHHSGAYPP